jgi:hypothetical protein
MIIDLTQSRPSIFTAIIHEHRLSSLLPLYGRIQFSKLRKIWLYWRDQEKCTPGAGYINGLDLTNGILLTLSEQALEDETRYEKPPC